MSQARPPLCLCVCLSLVVSLVCLSLSVCVCLYVCLSLPAYASAPILSLRSRRLSPAPLPLLARPCSTTPEHPPSPVHDPPKSRARAGHPEGAPTTALKKAEKKNSSRRVESAILLLRHGTPLQHFLVLRSCLRLGGEEGGDIITPPYPCWGYIADLKRQLRTLMSKITSIGRHGGYLFICKPPRTDHSPFDEFVTIQY